MNKELEVFENSVRRDVQRLEVPAKPEMTAMELIQHAQTMIQSIDVIKKTAIQLTNYNDWERLGNKPYLTVDGGDKFIIPFGIQQVGDPFFEREDFTDKSGQDYFIYTCVTKFKLPTGAIVSGMGTSRSNSDFFSNASEKYKEKTGKDKKEFEDIEIGHVKTKAFSQSRRDAVVALLGLGNITWKDIENANVDAEAIKQAGVDYGTKENNATPAYPKCKEKLRKDKDGNGYYCWKKKGGCGWSGNLDNTETNGDTGQNGSNKTDFKPATKVQLATLERAVAVMPELTPEELEKWQNFLAVPVEEKSFEKVKAWIDFFDAKAKGGK